MAALPDHAPQGDGPAPSPFAVSASFAVTGVERAALITLKKRAEFVAAQQGLKARSATFLIQLRPMSGDDGLRFGFTVTKKCGNAPERNRIRRRLKAAVLALLPKIEARGDFVIIARRDVLGLPYPRLQAEIERALSSLIRKSSG